jgi:hypothetical protein
MHTFITFGGGGDNYIEAGERLIKQAQNLELFDNSTLYTDEWLKNDLEFWTQHKDFFENVSIYVILFYTFSHLKRPLYKSNIFI